MRGFFKWLTTAADNNTKQVEAVQLWEVRWNARERDGYISNGASSPQLEAFTSEKDANEFATALQNAFRLTRNKVDNEVRVKKAK